MTGKRSWFSAKAVAAGGESPAAVEISIHDEIGGWGISASDFMAEVRGISGGAEEIHLSIHSPGGSVLDGWAIYNALKAAPQRVTAKIEGLAASMATVIAMAADEVEMPENAFFMIHNPWSVAVGDAEAMRDTADLLDKMSEGITNAYAAKSGLDVEEVRELMAAETWMTGKEAAEKGFVDSVTEELAMAAVVGDVRAETLAHFGLPELPQAFGRAGEEPAGAGDPVEVVAEKSDATEEEEPEKKGFLDKVSAMLTGKRQAAGGGADVVAALTAKVSELESLASARFEEVSALKMEREELFDRIERMESEQASVVELVAEAGYSAAVAEELPAPASENAAPAQASAEQIKARFRELPKGKERTEFYQKHRAVLEGRVR